MGKVSLIVPSFNTKKLLRDCLLSLKNEGSKIEKEIIVVDNASADGSGQMVKKEFPQVKLRENKQNLGFAKANNQAAKVAQGEYLFFLNSDTQVKPRTLDKLAEFINRNEKLAAVSPLVLNEDGSVQKDPCYLRFPSPLRVFLYYNKFLRQFTLKIFPQLLLSSVNFEKPSEVEQLPGAAMMVRKEILDKIGGFDEDFPVYFEDSDLSWRLRKLGYKLMLIPQAQIIHLGRKSIESLIQKEGLEKFYFLNFRSLFLFCKKHYPRSQTLLIKALVFLHLLLTRKFGLIKKLLAR